jgi:hypothetical protein
MLFRNTSCLNTFFRAHKSTVILRQCEYKRKELVSCRSHLITSLVYFKTVSLHLLSISKPFPYATDGTCLRYKKGPKPPTTRFSCLVTCVWRFRCTEDFNDASFNMAGCYRKVIQPLELFLLGGQAEYMLTNASLSSSRQYLRIALEDSG